MMEPLHNAARLGVMTLAIVAIWGVSPCSAQMSLSSGSPSLGGYGGAVLDTRSDSGMPGTIIPYGGTFSGFTPYRTGGGRSLAFGPRGRANLDEGQMPFRLSPMSIGSGLGGNSGLMSPRFMPTTKATRGMSSVMPPNFGSPFRRPPSLLSPNATGAGMSM